MFNFSEINKNPAYLSLMSDLDHAILHISPFIGIPTSTNEVVLNNSDVWRSAVLKVLESPDASKYRDLRLAILYLYVLDGYGGIFSIQQAYAKDREKYLKVFKRIRIISGTLATIGFTLGITPLILSLLDPSKGFSALLLCITIVIAVLNIAIITHMKPLYFEDFEPVLMKANAFARLIKTNMDIVVMIVKNPAYANDIEDVYNDIRKSIDEVSRL